MTCLLSRSSTGPTSKTISFVVLHKFFRTQSHWPSKCPEEPYDHELQPGDVEIRFRGSRPYDVSGLNVVVEVRSKWFASRAENRQERCAQLCDAMVEAAGTRSVGVYISLPVAGWAQRA
jgi:hypothetical protein